MGRAGGPRPTLRHDAPQGWCAERRDVGKLLESSRLVESAPTEAGKLQARQTDCPPVERGTLLAGRYRVLGELGEGGMGTVYDAFDERTGRPVAVKVLARRWSHEERARERFLREARATQAMRHPNVIEVYEYGVLEEESDQRPYLAMERLEGETLWHRINREGTMVLDDVLPLVDQTAVALAEVHARGVLHRDVKPENLFLHRIGRGHEMLKLLDFGLVLDDEDEERLTQEGCFVGTPEYMAPELAQGRDAGPATDVYGLAASVFEALTGHPPHRGSSHFQVLVKKQNSPAPRLEEVGPGPYSEAVERVIATALDRNPSKRQQSTMAFAAELRHASSAKGSGPRRRPTAPTPTPAPRLDVEPERHPTRRNTAGILGGIAAVGAVVAVALWIGRDLDVHTVIHAAPAVVQRDVVALVEPPAAEVEVPAPTAILQPVEISAIEPEAEVETAPETPAPSTTRARVPSRRAADDAATAALVARAELLAAAHAAEARAEEAREEEARAEEARGGAASAPAPDSPAPAGTFVESPPDEWAAPDDDVPANPF